MSRRHLINSSDVFCTAYCISVFWDFRFQPQLQNLFFLCPISKNAIKTLLQKKDFGIVKILNSDSTLYSLNENLKKAVWLVLTSTYHIVNRLNAARKSNKIFILFLNPQKIFMFIWDTVVICNHFWYRADNNMTNG